MELYYDVFPTHIGWFAGVISERGLREATLKKSPEAAMESLRHNLFEINHCPNKLEAVKHSVINFLNGETDDLYRLTLDVDDAPEFYQAAWKACVSIPLGETRSYAWLAKQSGSPLAYRAAGQAMAKNRIVLAIPCHRVIGSNGGLHGYAAGGLGVKDHLLKIEAGLRHRVCSMDNIDV